MITTITIWTNWKHGARTKCNVCWIKQAPHKKTTRALDNLNPSNPSPRRLRSNIGLILFRRNQHVFNQLRTCDGSNVGVHNNLRAHCVHATHAFKLWRLLKMWSTPQSWAEISCCLRNAQRHSFSTATSGRLLVVRSCRIYKYAIHAVALYFFASATGGVAAKNTNTNTHTKIEHENTNNAARTCKSRQH